MKTAFLHTYRKALRRHEEVRLFGEGLQRHGWNVYGGELHDFKGADLVVQWNVRLDNVISQVLDGGGESCVLETSYIEPRRGYVSVSFGRWVNNRNKFYGPFDDPSRWERFFAKQMRPEYDAPEDGYILIMGQMPGDMATKPHVNFFDWVRDTYIQCKEDSWSDIFFRPHPSMPVLGRKPKMRKYAKVCVHPEELELWRGLEEAQELGLRIRQGDPLKEALAGAKLVVTFNSNSGVDALLYGRPVVTMDEGSMAWAITGHSLTDIRKPDRQAWAHRLAWCQWSRDELKSGECWEYAAPERLR